MPDAPELQAIQQLGRSYRALLTAFEARIGHSMPRWRILMALHRNGTLSQKALAQQLSMDPAALTRQIKAIEGLGWITREADAQDNRLTNVVLTPAGTDIVREAMPRRRAFIASVFGDMPVRDIQALTTLLETIERSLRDQAEKPTDTV